MSELVRVTAADLRALGACEEQVRTFEDEWPDEVEVTREVLARAAELGLNTEWWFLQTFPTRYAECRAKRAPIYAEFYAKLAPINAEFEAKRALLVADLLGLEVTKGGQHDR